MVVMREGRAVQSGTPRKIFEQPANVDVARLLGLYNLLPVEIRALDPGRNSSRLRYQDFELTGPYFPGRLIGDHVWLYVRPDRALGRAPQRPPGVQSDPRHAAADRGKTRARCVWSFPATSPWKCRRAPFDSMDKYSGVKEWVVEFPQPRSAHFVKTLLHYRFARRCRARRQ